MKKAKVVEQANKRNRLITGKRAVLMTTAAVAVLGTVAVVVPTSNIPGFSYIAQTLGLSGNDMRDLTMADFAAYAAGAKNSKVALLREGNTAYDTGGGLSPFSNTNRDRLAEVYAKNSQPGYVMEGQDESGYLSPFENNEMMRNITFETYDSTKGFDPSQTGFSADKAAYARGLEALAAAAAKQTDAFGKPLSKNDLSQVDGMVGSIIDSNASHIIGTGDIVSVASKDDMLYYNLSKRANAMLGTSIFGSVNPDFTRTDTRIGRPVYGIFKDLGTAFFFSRYGAGAKLPTAASDIAAAAFDGGSPQDQSIITKEETPQAPSANPEQELAEGAQSVNMCAQVADANRALIKALSQTITAQLQAMFTIRAAEGINSSYLNIPGCCVPVMGANNKTLSARHKWNYYLYGGGVPEHMRGGVPNIERSFKLVCEDLIATRNTFANQCGITFEDPEYTCAQMAQKLKLGSCLRQRPAACPDIAIFGSSDSTTNISRRKLEDYQQRFIYYTTREEDPLPEDEAMTQAAIDVGISEPDNSGELNVPCTDIPQCLEYINGVLEKTFAVENILDVRGILVGLWGENKQPSLRQYDANMLRTCQKMGDMSDCQDIIDYYSGDVWEEQCSQYNSMLNNPDTSTYSDCDIIWLAINGKI